MNALPPLRAPWAGVAEFWIGQLDVFCLGSNRRAQAAAFELLKGKPDSSGISAYRFRFHPSSQIGGIETGQKRDIQPFVFQGERGDRNRCHPANRTADTLRAVPCCPVDDRASSNPSATLEVTKCGSVWIWLIGPVGKRLWASGWAAHCEGGLFAFGEGEGTGEGGREEEQGDAGGEVWEGTGNEAGV